MKISINNLIIEDIKIKGLSIQGLIYLVTAFSLIFLSLNFILNTGFISDDSYNSQVRGTVLNNGSTIVNHFYNETKGWILGAGRFFPLHWYPYLIYYFTQSEVLIKTINLIVISFGLFFFGLFTKEITNSFKVGLITIVATPIFFQLRAWHDPILSFTFLLPLIFLYLIVSLYLYQKFLNNNKNIYLYWSAIFHFLGLLTYEAGYLFFIIFIILALSSEKDTLKAIKKSWLPVGLNLLVILISILLKSKFNSEFNNDYPGANLHLNFSNFVKAFSIQFSSGIPLNYLIFSKFVSLKEVWLNSSFLSVGLSVIIIFGLLSSLEEKINFKILIYIGGSLMVLPAVLMGVSGHQKSLADVGFGFGYLPVYFQYFGFSFFSLGSILFIKNKFLSKGGKNVINILFIIMFFLIGLLHSGQNKFVANSTNSFYLYPRVLLKEALTSNLSSYINSKSIVIRAPRYPYDNEWFFSTTLDFPIHVSDVNFFQSFESNFYVTKLTNGISQIIPKERDVWLLAYNGNNYPNGYLYAGKLKYAYVSDLSKKTSIAVIDKLFIFANKKLTEIKINSTVPIDFMKIINSQNIYDSLNTNINNIENKYSFDDVHLHWDQINPMEGDNENNVRWSSGKGELVFHNFSSEMKKFIFSIQLAMPMDGNSNVTIQYLNSIETIQIHQKHINFSKEIILAPGESRIKFSSDGEPLLNGDPRMIVFGIFNFKYYFL
jgi:hypothetical protein